jgi:high-affinity nickel permease
VAIALTATALKEQFDLLKGVGGVVGTLASASFLLAIALMNVVILVGVYRVRALGPPQETVPVQSSFQVAVDARLRPLRLRQT